MQEEPRLGRDPASAVGRQAITRNDHVDVRVMGESRSPSVQHAGHTDPRAAGPWHLGQCLFLHEL